MSKNGRTMPRARLAVMASALALGLGAVTAHAQANLARDGTGYRWWGNASPVSNANRVAARGLNDGNLDTNINLHGSGGEAGTAFEAAGVVWPTARSFSQLKLFNGTWVSSGDGAFCADLQLQVTQDGSSWVAVAWPVSPGYGYDSAASSGVAYSFSGPLLSARGVRVAGRLRCAENSSYWANVRELQVFNVPGGGIDTSPPTVPAGLNAQAASATRIDLGWSASSDNVGVVAYQVFRNSGGTPIAQPTSTSFSDTTVAPSTSYGYQVRALDAAGNASALSSIVLVATPASPGTTVPAAPTGLVAVPGNAQVVLSWSAVGNASSYKIYRSGGGGSGSVVSSSAVPNFTDTGLSNGSSYSYQVSGVNKAGEGPKSLTATAVPTPPLPPGGGTITHGMQLTLDKVGPAGIAITSLVDVPGGTFSGTPLNGWGANARIVGPGAEVIDGYDFPPGTVVLQGVNLRNQVVVASGWLVLRGSKGSLLLNHPAASAGGGAALYSELSAFNTVGAKDGRQPAKAICHRCLFPHSGLENVYSNNVTITESWIAVDPGQAGDHVDGIQTWGGQSQLTFSRNRLQWNGNWNSTQSGLIAMYSDGAQGGSEGYDQVRVQDNYIVIGAGGGIGLHAPMGVATRNMTVTGNRWTWVTGADPDYSPAVYRANGAANYKTNGNTWSDNRWSDGPYANQFLRPDNSTGAVDY